eukprot:9491619-Pyramimonas_sp.AAC.2
MSQRCRRRRWPDHLSSGHFATQNSEDVSDKRGRITMGHGILETRVARMPLVTVTRRPWGKTPPRSEL